MRQVTIKRAYLSDRTNGILTIDDNYSFDSIELPDLNNSPMVSCIKADTFLCTWQEMHDHPGHFHYRLEDKNGRSGIFIHHIDMTKPPQGQLEGCIGLSPQSCATFEQIMDKQPFVLVISG